MELTELRYVVAANLASELPLVSWSRERFERYYSQKEGEPG
jgi:hypothetical protein